MQQLPHIEKTVSREEFSCIKGTKNGKRIVCLNFKTDTSRLKNVADRYKNCLYLKDNEVDLKFREYQPLLIVSFSIELH